MIAQHPQAGSFAYGAPGGQSSIVPVQTWRDLSDQLTPEQVARFERSEAMALASIAAGRNPYETADDIVGGLLTEARWEAEQNLTDRMINVPLPPGAEEAEHWSEDDGEWTRTVHGGARSVDGFDAAVYRTGTQASDGAVTWLMYVHVDDHDDMTAEQVRQLAAKLVEAADELEQLSS
ncbi:hypothetical protein [Mycolicibacterium frederiksbergense]|uniref:hypothetical protein n=1 Tax=Mycolicibacterium frederiksbergense TaxID=117567 RepID=UPI00265BDDA1|nr:hypothetical protein [Mycolicibacterium frederiksbergense]MDO0975982.1 hypothetical protein [Mycolicibacterium frederiksbergense]